MTVQTVPAYLQNASHSAAVFRQATTAPFASAGTLTAAELAVTAQGTPNMSVQVAAGRAMVAGSNVSPPSGFAFTTQGMYSVLNDAPISVTIAAADATNPRIDVVYVGVQDSFYSGSNNQVVIAVVTGTPLPSPVAPAAPASSLVLATVAVAANATTITSGNITDSAPVATSLGSPVTVNSVQSYSTGWSATSGYIPYVRADGPRREIFGAVTRSTTLGALATIVRVQPSDYPPHNTFLGGKVDSSGVAGELYILPSGWISIPSSYGDAGNGAIVPLSGAWYVDQ